MQITPFGKLKDDSFRSLADSLFPTSDEEDSDGEDGIPDSDDRGDIIQNVENAISDVLGDPSLDNLMVILHAIGMSNVSLSLSDNNEKLSVSGVIELSSDQKIKKV